MKIATISSKGQITLPRSFMRELQMQPRQKVFIEKDNDRIKIRPIPSSIAEKLAGSLKKHIHPSKLGVPWEVVMQETKKRVAEKLAKE